MQVSKDYIRKDITDAAQKLFLKKGYANVSMREIATKAQVGLSNMYNYFKNKDDLFRHLAQPAIDAMEALLEKHHGVHGKDMMEMRSEDFIRETISDYVGILKKYKKEMNLLLFRARGSSLQNFKEDFTNKSTVIVRQYLSNEKVKHEMINDGVSDFFIHMHTVWMFSLIEELLRQKINDEKLEKILNEYIRFEAIGWRELIEI